MLDLCYEEDSSADVDFNVVITGDGEYVEVQGTAEHGTFDRDSMNLLLSLAEKGVRDSLSAQQSALAKAGLAGP